MNTLPEFHAKAPQAPVSEGLAQDPYVAARVGVEPTTLWMKGVDSTNAPHKPHICWVPMEDVLCLVSAPQAHTKIVHLKLPFIQDRVFSIETPANNPDCSLLLLAVTKTPKHYHITSVLESLHWLKVSQCIHCKIISLTLQTCQPSDIRQLPSNRLGLLAHHHLSLSWPSASSALKYCNCS